MRGRHFSHGAIENFSQPVLPGMPEPAPKRPEPAPRTPTALEGRVQRREQNRQRWESMRVRMEDEGVGDGITADLRFPASKSGGGRSGGTEYVENLGMTWSYPVPTEVSFHGSSPSSWRRFARPEEVPIVGIKTEQPTVSVRRMEQARRDPSTRSSPRWPKGLEERPRVYRDPEGSHHVVDGNHRIASSIANGQMIHPAYVLEEKDFPDVMAHTKKRRWNAEMAVGNPNRHPESDERLNRLYGFE